MNIWLVTTGEPLQLQNERPHRVGILSNKLVKQNHNVIWWTTTFDHQSKNYIYDNDKEVIISEKLKMTFMHSSIGYRKNVSLNRLINHKLVADKFRRLAESKKTPDIIYCSFPTIDLSYQAVKYGIKNNIPVIIDTRDLWPDIFINPFPKFSHSLINLLLSKYIKQTKYLFKNCESITAVSEKYLNWALNYGSRKRTINDQVFPLAYEKHNNSNNDNLTNQIDAFSKIGINPSKKIAWFVGTFGRTYDLTTVIKSARILENNEVNDIQFVLTGDGEKMNEWSKLAKGLKNVVFTGWVNKPELQYLSSIADIGLMAYSKGAPQGLPNKIFEYMSAGVPILSSLQSETKELLSKNKIGLTYEPLNVDGFVEKLLYLCKDDLLREQMGTSGKELLEKEYTADIVYDRLIQHLEKQSKKNR